MIDSLFITAAQAAPAGEGGGKTIDPMQQFEIVRYVPIEIFGVDASFTNASLWMLLAVALISTFLIYSMRNSALVPNRVQSVGEITYKFVANMVRQNAGDAGMQFFPLIFSIFIFVLILNLLGLVPIPFLGTYTVTSHIIVTFALAMVVFTAVVVVGIYKNGFGFLRLFAPSGVPAALLPLIAVIELVSFLVRPFSLSIRLFANMIAGHMILKILASFTVALGLLAGWVPLLFMIAVTALEVLVAVLQAYVFALLSCIYLNDALHASDH